VSGVILFRERLSELQDRSEDGDVDRGRAMETYPLGLTMPPSLEEKPAGEARETIHQETAERTRRWVDNNRLDRDGCVGARGVRKQNPVDRPEEAPDDPEPMCIAEDPEAREAYREHRRTVPYRTAMDKWRNGDTDVTFPPGTCPPGWTEYITAEDETDSNSTSGTADQPHGDPADASA